ncbi:MAG: hypothetical protein KC656_10970 [Myxococcales bacterium]|nr:hypothetical protein [Myxococcales bacterium]MCB9691785.1 hypothetical protein [Alphaproteobacteria bacterium]
MEETDIRALRDQIENALRRKVDSLPEDAQRQDYARFLSRIRALRALSGHVLSLDAALSHGHDAGLAAERQQAVAAMAHLAEELAR